MKYLVVIVFVIAYITSVEFRTLCKHPLDAVKYAVIDSYRYFHDRKWNLYEGGILNCYSAPFGGGKTLSIVEYVIYLFNKYNNKMVYDRKLGEWRLQKVHILSNVEFKGVPYEKLNTLGQIVQHCKVTPGIDAENGTRTVCLVVIDEASAEMNSRNFKDNINGEFLNKLLTIRHACVSIFYSSQKFHLTDKLLRQVTQTVIWCKKKWRILIQYSYEADQMENCTDHNLIQPLKTYGLFITDKIYNAYDTLACVDTLEKQWKSGDLLSEQEILELRGEMNPNVDMVNPSKKLKKRMKRK